MFFEERQRFLSNALLQAFLVLLLAIALALGLWSRGTAGPSPLAVLFAGVLALGLVVLMELRVVVRPGEVEIHMWPFRRKVIPVQDIVEYEPRTYRPILEYGGWGIRFGPRGWAYNVSGNRGVQLRLRDGKRILIGSQKADELARAIAEARGERRA
jgi:hypothetical protein